MISQKNLRILFILKFIPFFLKKEITAQGAQLQALERVSTPEAEDQKKQLREKISDFETQLAVFNQLNQDGLSRKDFVKVLNSLIQRYKGDITHELAGRFSVDFNKKEEAFDFSIGRNIPQEVVDFLKKPIPDEIFINYQKLPYKEKQQQLPNFFNFNQLKWDFWYWPKLCYGQKNQLSAWVYRFGSVLKILGGLLTLTFFSMLPIGFWGHVSIFGFLAIIAGWRAKSENQQNIMHAIIAFLVVAAIVASMIFCPPLSLTLLFGLHLTGAMMMFNFAPVAIISLVATIIKTVVEPSNEPEQQALFAPSVFSKPQKQEIKYPEKENALRKAIQNQPYLSKLFEKKPTSIPSTSEHEDDPNLSVQGRTKSS